jgi:hypothetical protein
VAFKTVAFKTVAFKTVAFKTGFRNGLSGGNVPPDGGVPR